MMSYKQYDVFFLTLPNAPQNLTKLPFEF